MYVFNTARESEINDLNQTVINGNASRSQSSAEILRAVKEPKVLWTEYLVKSNIYIWV